MIYEMAGPAEPIRQGDIFQSIPRVDINLSELAVVGDDDELRQTTWIDVVSQGSAREPIAAILSLRSVAGIVITQNCDTARGQFVALCQIDDYLEAINKKENPPKTDRKWKNLIVETTRTNNRFYYLPEDSSFGFL